MQSMPAFAAFALTAFQRRSRSANEYPFQIWTVAPEAGGVVQGMIITPVSGLGFRVKHGTRNPKRFSSNRHHSRRPLHQRLAAFVRHEDAAAPAGIEAVIGGFDDGLEDKNISALDQHVAVARAAVLRREQRAVVAVTAAVHEHDTLRAALLAKAVDEIHELGERLTRRQVLERRVVKIVLNIDGSFPLIGNGSEKNRLLLLCDQAAE